MGDHLIIGQAAKLQVRCTVDEVNTDPTTLSLEVKDPSGNTDTYTYALSQITREAAGKFYKVITFDEAGWWIYEWQGTGAVIDVASNKIYVRAQLI